VIFGPPGTGKTTRVLSLLKEELASGTPPDRIAVVTFTRAAKREVLDRVGRQFSLDQAGFPWLRTIHSTAFRLLGLTSDRIMNRERWQEFEEIYHYRFSRLAHEDPDGDPSAPPRDTEDDLFRYVYEWGRNRQLSPERAIVMCSVGGVPASAFLLFVARLEKFKAEHGLLDFADMLDAVLARGLRPPVGVAFVDEAQDLSPLQIAVVEFWFGPCDRVYVAGDDDQAIYGFQGADPTWLLDLASRSPHEVLKQSYRLPVAVQIYADRIIARNSARVPKAYLPRNEFGDVRHADFAQAMARIDGERSTFVLVRNRFFLRLWSDALLQKGVPFVVEGRGARSPLSNPGLRHAIDVAVRLRCPETHFVDADDLDALLAFVPTRTGLVPRGMKTRVAAAKVARERIPRRQLTDRFGLGCLLHALDGGIGPVLAKLSGDEARYVAAVVDKNGHLPEPRVILTTIHGAKGREADLVVLATDMTRATFDEYTKTRQAGIEAENRVFYVGASRARRELVIVDPRTRRHFDRPKFDLVKGEV
jgi:DNA helicase-2/ATP-dependent DNA helicase PcrA